MVRPYVIIGTGAAGMAAAERLRLLKPDIPIQMMSIDEYSHSRCMLHKYLGGERDEKGLSFVAAPSMGFRPFRASARRPMYLDSGI